MRAFQVQRIVLCLGLFNDHDVEGCLHVAHDDHIRFGERRQRYVYVAALRLLL